MRVAGIALVSWLAAMLLTALASSLYHGEVPSAADAAGLAGGSFVGCALLLVACYLPGLRLLRRSRFGASPAASALAAALVFNIPGFLTLALTASQADAFAAGEVWWLAGLVGLFGALFGFGHARLRHRGLTRA